MGHSAKKLSLQVKGEWDDEISGNFLIKQAKWNPDNMGSVGFLTFSGIPGTEFE